MRVRVILPLALILSLLGCLKNNRKKEYLRILQDVDVFIRKSDSALSVAWSIGQYQSAVAEIEQQIKSQFLPTVDSLILRETNANREAQLRMIKDFLILYCKMSRNAQEEAKLRELRKRVEELIKKELHNAK